MVYELLFVPGLRRLILGLKLVVPMLYVVLPKAAFSGPSRRPFSVAF
jgi:hypothetical protein